jgi:hypothetical protein
MHREGGLESGSGWIEEGGHLPGAFE